MVGYGCRRTNGKTFSQVHRVRADRELRRGIVSCASNPPGPLCSQTRKIARYAQSLAHHDRAITAEDVAASLITAKTRKDGDVRLDDGMCRSVHRCTVKQYLEVFGNMPREQKIGGDNN